MKDAGFTLLEVMIAMAILAIALTSLFGSQSASVALASETRFNIQAPLLAQMQLARLHSAENIITDSGDFGDDFPGFQWKLTVEDAIFPESDLLQQLDGKLQHLILVVSWGKECYSYQLDSYQRSSQ
jgi:general secretion pathway protein I